MRQKKIDEESNNWKLEDPNRGRWACMENEENSKKRREGSRSGSVYVLSIKSSRWMVDCSEDPVIEVMVQGALRRRWEAWIKSRGRDLWGFRRMELQSLFFCVSVSHNDCSRWCSTRFFSEFVRQNDRIPSIPGWSGSLVVPSPQRWSRDMGENKHRAVGSNLPCTESSLGVRINVRFADPLNPSGFGVRFGVPTLDDTWEKENKGERKQRDG